MTVNLICCDATTGKTPAPAMRILESPIGPLRAAAVREGICFLDFDAPEYEKRQERDIAATFGIPSVKARNAHLTKLAKELDEYFAGKRREFSVPLVVSGTPFQVRVWEALSRIPFGAVRTYADVAADIGSPAAFRAVGNANGKNRIVILIPCHRVIASGGDLGGYGGGLPRKQFLLDLEKKSV